MPGARLRGVMMHGNKGLVEFFYELGACLPVAGREARVVESTWNSYQPVAEI